jgi:hypothetical protein
MIVCADDYGLSAGIDEAILDLCRRGKVSAVSCMVALQQCHQESMARLTELKSSLDIGLHLCFTDVGLAFSQCPAWPEGQPPKLPSFLKLVSRLYLGFEVPHLAKTIAAQYELFVQKCGEVPAFIDGHLYAHQLLSIADALEAFVQSLPAESRPYVRNTDLSLPDLRSRRLPWLKAALIGRAGRQIRQRLRKVSIRTNQGFAGIYDFKRFRQYPSYLPRFVECLSHRNGILVTHPGRGVAWREQELAALLAFSFPPGKLNCFEGCGLEGRSDGIGTAR